MAGFYFNKPFLVINLSGIFGDCAYVVCADTVFPMEGDQMTAL